MIPRGFCAFYSSNMIGERVFHFQTRACNNANPQVRAAESIQTCSSSFQCCESLRCNAKREKCTSEQGRRNDQIWSSMWSDLIEVKTRCVWPLLRKIVLLLRSKGYRQMLKRCEKIQVACSMCPEVNLKCKCLHTVLAVHPLYLCHGHH